MAATQTAQVPTSDILNWQLRGIRAEREQLKARLEFLDKQEERLVGQGLTGAKPAAKPKAKSDKGTPQRTRVFTAEQKRKMSEAATKRWERKRAAEAAKQRSQSEPEGQEQQEGYAPPVEIPTGESASA